MTSTMRASRMGFILAGGKSSRMGKDKALLEFAGRTLLERAIAVVRESCGDAAIVGDARVFDGYGEVISDVYPGCGPLGGIHAALAQSAAELNLVLAVDMPFVSSRLLKLMLGTAETSSVAVTVPHTSRGFQPLCAVYRREFAALAEGALKAGKYKIDALFGQTSIRILGEADLAAAGFSERDFFNVNTPGELLSAQKSSATRST